VIKGAFKLKRTLLLFLLAAAPAAFLPLPASGQVNPEAAPATDQASPYKYEVYAGGAYSRIRQATQTFSGLIGGKATVARDWGKYFQLMGSVDYYRIGTGHGRIADKGDPSIYTVLVGPGIHATLYENLSVVLFGELGVEHTGGESITPGLSVAGGFGGGLNYALSRKFAVQLTGDRVGASFSLPGNSSELGNSTHITWNARGTIGVVYRF